MNRSSGTAALAISIVLFFSVAALGGTSSAHAATAFIVSGTVTTPGGIIASHGQSEPLSLASLLDFFVPPAQAGLSGLLPVPNGTRVELVRLGDRGFTSAPIAVTTTQYGRYRFNLTTLRLSVSSRLVVRVGNVATGGQLRAFVSDSTVDINPVTETAVRLVLDTIAATGGTLGNFTVRELEDLTGSLDLLTSANSTPAGGDIESSVADIRNAVAAETGITRFLTAIAQSGQTNIGPGDIGNFFPFTRGLGWTYTVQETEDGITRPSFTTTTTVGGTRLINGVATTVFRDSNPDGDDLADFNFYKKTTAGLFDWEPVKDRQMSRPFQFVRFPAAPGSTFKQSVRGIFDTDIDRDGIVERFNLGITTTVVGLETLNVPAGALPKTLKIRSVISGGTTVSSTGKRIALTVTVTEWYTRNLGLSKQTLNSRVTYDGMLWRDTRTLQLTEVSGFPYTGEFPLDRWTSLDIESNDIAYDKVSGKLFASVPSDAQRYADHVVVINPISAQVEAAIPVGTNPGALAVSDDGQFLYAGLGGNPGSIRQISIPTLSAGAEWTLSNGPGTATARYAHDIAVQPGHSEVVIVSTSTHPDILDFAGAMALDRGVERPTAVPEHPNRLYNIVFSEDPTLAYGFNFEWQRRQLVGLSIAPDGITMSEISPCTEDRYLEKLKYANGRLYAESTAIDVQTCNVLGTYTSGYYATGTLAIEPVASRNRVAVAKNVVGFLVLESYDLDSYAKLHDLFIDVSRPGYVAGSPTHIESFGTDGYAIRLSFIDLTFGDVSSSRLFLIRSAQNR